MRTNDYLLLTDVPDMVSIFDKVYSLQYSVLMPIVNKQQLLLYTYPYQRKSMGIVWKRLGHIWPICGNGMGRLGDDMKLIWAIILPNFKLWKMHGKKSLW